MNNKISIPQNTSKPIPDQWETHLKQVLNQDETVCAWLEINLDANLNFTEHLLVVTNQRLLYFDDSQSKSSHLNVSIKDYPYNASIRLDHSDHAGVFRLDLLQNDILLNRWFYTLNSAAATDHFIRQFNWQSHHFLTGESPRADREAPCPQCGFVMSSDMEECPRCASALDSPPSTWTLLRLWRFAKPYQWQLLAGFLLMLASTAATLVPPYLTIPLMDRVLIPYQNGQAIDYTLVSYLLAGLFGSALLAWVLGWSKTYILALVSERIGADLRTVTYEHLLKLSLEYFGGKRTGDLMARIGSESDRICVFLSLHLLDFATDVLMIMMTAAILISINLKLALVTLLPLPFIAWMIHLVRDRLRTGFEKIDRVWSEVSNVLADTIPGIRVVKAFAQERRESGRFKEANRHNLAVNDRC